MFRIMYAFYKMKLLSPLGLFSLISAIHKYGMNMMALLGFAAKVYTNKTALVDEEEELTYRELLSQSEKLSVLLKENYQLQGGQRVGLICKNHASLIKSIFAVSQLGADVYLVNAEMSENQFHYLLDQNDFDLLIYDAEWHSIIEHTSYHKEKLLSYHQHLPAINNLLHNDLPDKTDIKRSSSSKLVLRTGGTTGLSKIAAHKPSILNYLNPFLSLLTRAKLTNYKTVYIATPIYHGYGIAILLLFTALGKKIVIHKGFEVDKACSIIRNHNVEVVTVVPLMIHRMLKHNPDDLKTLTCILSGGADLNPKLVTETFSILGDVLFNLYGTSEGGLSTIATPKDLRKATNTIGKRINGLQLKILDENKNVVETGEIGQLCVKNSWSMSNRNNTWIETGDLGYQYKNGLYFLRGRADDMIVSAGENVYPLEVEQIIKSHPQVEDVAVIGIHDDTFGKRLKAYILLEKQANITIEELFEWLRHKVARFQIPKDIIFVKDMPRTPLGKLDKKKLR